MQFTLLSAISLFVLGSFLCLLLGDYTEQERDIWPILTYLPHIFLWILIVKFFMLIIYIFCMLVLCTIIEISEGSRERPGQNKLSIIHETLSYSLKATCFCRNAFYCICILERKMCVCATVLCIVNCIKTNYVNV